MKILCDVCSAAAASVFCCADEAALCGACDRRVHGANKLAGKHPRLALLHHPNSDASSTTTTLCDICKEKKGLLFCQQDRVILCRDCDFSIHGSNELAAKHDRFLIAGVGLSSKPMPMPLEAVSEASCNNRISNSSGNDSSSISEYLTKMLPGWHVEDFLLDDAAAADDSAVTTDADCVYDQANEFLAFTGSSVEKEKRKQRSGAAFMVPHFESDCNSSKRHRTSAAAAFW